MKESILLLLFVCLYLLPFLYVTHSLGFGKSSRVDGKQKHWCLRVQDCVWGWQGSLCGVKFSIAIHPHISRLAGKNSTPRGWEKHPVTKQFASIHPVLCAYTSIFLFAFFLSFINMFSYQDFGTVGDSIFLWMIWIIIFCFISWTHTFLKKLVW
jgi:hypothetical protein